MKPADLKHWLESLNISQNEGARRLQVSKNSMTYWLRGERDIPHVVGLACAALAAGIEPYSNIRTVK